MSDQGEQYILAIHRLLNERGVPGENVILFDRLRGVLDGVAALRADLAAANATIADLRAQLAEAEGLLRVEREACRIARDKSIAQFRCRLVAESLLREVAAYCQPMYDRPDPPHDDPGYIIYVRIKALLGQGAWAKEVTDD